MAPTSTRPSSPRPTSRRSAAWLADTDAPEGAARRQGPHAPFAARGLPLAGLACDTALAAYLALPGQRTFDLADLALRYLGKELREEAEDGQLTLDGSGERDAAAALVLAPRPRWSGRGPGGGPGPARVGRAAARARAAAGLRAGQDGATGIAADVRPFAAMSAMLHGEAKAAEQAAYAVVGHEFNLGSPKQLQEVLFTELEPAEDQADQDRVHHRLRGADQPARADRPPGP